MEFMTYKAFARAHHQSMAAGKRFAIAQAQFPALGMEGQHASHGVVAAFAVAQGLT